ncbi:MAG: PGRS repeat-containing protein, partial [Mycobacterium sp.]
MTVKRQIQGNRRSHNAKARRRGGEVIGAASVVGAFFAFAMTPLATPPARADFIDDLFDPSLWGSLFDPSSLGNLDVQLPGGDEAIAGALASSSTVDPQVLFGGPTDSLLGASGLAVADSNPLADAFQSFYLPIHTALEAWIASPLGMQVDGFLNSLVPASMLGNFCGLICDGASGTEANPDGEWGGSFFVDGGDGWNSTEAGVAGGNGGDAGGIGNGGDGG